MKLRNTAIRIIVSLLAIPVILLATITGSYYFLAFVLLIALISYQEFVEFAKKKSAFPLSPVGYIAVAAFILNAFFHFTDYYIVANIVIVPSMLIELFRNKHSALLNLGVSFLGIFYVGFFLSTLVEIREFFPIYQYGGYLITSVLASIWVCDSAAFFGGTALGKHRLFLRVSPKKSWEGAFFGFAFAIITMAVAKSVLLNFLTWQDVIIIGAVVGTIGQMGDLVESLLKRDAGVKDSSKLIPGHGGMLDRFDSLLLVAPVIFLYLKFFFVK